MSTRIWTQLSRLLGSDPADLEADAAFSWVSSELAAVDRERDDRSAPPQSVPGRACKIHDCRRHPDNHRCARPLFHAYRAPNSTSPAPAVAPIHTQRRRPDARPAMPAEAAATAPPRATAQLPQLMQFPLQAWKAC